MTRSSLLSGTLLSKVLSRRSLCTAILVLALLAPGSWRLCADTGVTQEYKVKGAFLYNFALYVEWPATAFARDNSTFTIGILGKNPFGYYLDKRAGQSVKNRRIVVRTLAGVEEGAECQLVFISASERGRLHQILSALGKTQVLTVSDIEGFAKAGGMIGLVAVE